MLLSVSSCPTGCRWKPTTAAKCQSCKSTLHQVSTIIALMCPCRSGVRIQAPLIYAHACRLSAQEALYVLLRTALACKACSCTAQPSSMWLQEAMYCQVGHRGVVITAWSHMLTMLLLSGASLSFAEGIGLLCRDVPIRRVSVLCVASRQEHLGTPSCLTPT